MCEELVLYGDSSTGIPKLFSYHWSLNNGQITDTKSTFRASYTELNELGLSGDIFITLTLTQLTFTSVK